MLSIYFKRIFHSLIILFALFGIINIATAAAIAPIPANDCADWGIKTCQGEGDAPSDIIDYFWLGIQVVLSFLAIIATAALVYYGILYIISRGEEDKARQAKTGIVSALMGMLIVGLAAWIVNAIINL